MSFYFISSFFQITPDFLQSGQLTQTKTQTGQLAIRFYCFSSRFWHLFLQLITIRIYLKTKKEMFNSKKKGIKKMLVLDNIKYVTNIKATLHMN